MRKFYAIILFSLTFFVYKVNAQEPCATVFSPEMKQWLSYYTSHRNEFPASALDREVYYIPLKIHIVGTSNATKYYRLDFLWDLLCELNQKFAETGFHFYLYEDVHFIPNDDYFAHDFNSGSDMMLQNNVAGATNVYIVEDPAGYCGYYTYYEDAVTVAKSCSNPMSTTLAHELGHYFSLPHPFSEVNGISEYVDGSNCTIGGDLFCDTRADFLDYRWACPYTGNDLDGHGDEYDPDETLFMSYSYDMCQDKFSPEQMDAMVNMLLTNRQDLLNHPDPDITSVTEVPVYIYPKDSAINVPHDWVAFNWDPVDDAEFYNLQVTYTLNFASTPMIDIMVEETAFTAVLLPEKTYRWRVIPVKHGNTCVPEVPTYVFTTVMGTGVESYQVDENGLAVTPTLINKGESIHLSLIAKESTPSEIRLISVDGKTVKNFPVNILPGENNWDINTNEMSPGMYMLSLYSEGSIFREKIMIAE